MESSSLEERLQKFKKERYNNDNNDTLAWVIKSRQIEEERKKKRKQKNYKDELKKAKQTSNLLDQYEDDISNDYEGYQLKGLQVAHDINDFNEGESIILTLKDSYILNDKNELNNEEDILENVKFAEKDKFLLAKEATKKGYNVYEEIETGDTTDVLKKYDEQKTKDGFRLAGSITSSLSKEEKLAQIRKKLGNSLLKQTNNKESKQIQYSLESSNKLMNEYLPQTFRKKKRRKKKKSSRKQVFSHEIQTIQDSNNNNNNDIIMSDTNNTSNNEQDHASQSKRNNYVNVELKKKQTKAKAYEKAIQKAKIESLTLLDEEAIGNEDDNEIYETLRKITKKKPKKDILSTSSIVSQVKNRRNQQRIDASTSNNKKILFTKTSEFCRNIDTINNDEEETRKRIEPAHRIEKQDILNNNEDNENNDNMDIDNNNNNKEQERIKLEEEELLSTKGIIATLNFLKKTGDVNIVKTDSFSGRRNDEQIKTDPDDPAPDINLNQYDSFGRILTPRERFRQLSYSFHGEGPGLNKLEKEKRKHKEELKARGMLVDDSESIQDRIKQEQVRTGNAHIELSAPATPVTKINRQNPLIKQKIKQSTNDKIGFGNITGVKRTNNTNNELPPTKKQKL